MTHDPATLGAPRAHTPVAGTDDRFDAIPAYPQAWEADVLLADGAPIRIRPIVPADGPALRRLHRSLSARTVYLRFFAAKPDLTDAEVRRFTCVDHHERVALVALSHGALVAVGRFDAVGAGVAEVAFVVRDDFQGLGLGSLLLEHLAAAAREVGIGRFVAEVLPANTRMLTTFREAGFDVTSRHDADVISVEFAVAATPASRAVREAREHRAERRSVARLLSPQAIAIVGEPGPLLAVATSTATNAVAGGFVGPITVVGVPAPAGTTSAVSMDEIPPQTDLAFVAVDPARLPDVISRLGEHGLHGVVLASASTDPGDDTWRARQGDLVDRARTTGMRIVGPNSLGLINTADDVRLNVSLMPTMPEQGGVGLFCQSAAIGRTLLERLATRGLGVSTFVSAGNRVDVSGNDLLQYWVDDDRTAVVLLYLESVGNARKFARLVRHIALHKPVVAVRLGGAEHLHPLGHAVSRTRLPATGVDQILADCGLTVVDRVTDLLDVAAIAMTQPLPGASPPVVVANSEALATLARNALAAEGFDTSREPLLVPRTADRAMMSNAVCAAATGAGLVLVAHVPAAEAVGDETLGPWPVEVPVVAVLPGSTARSAPAAVPVFADIEDAVVSLAHLARLARWRRAQDLAVTDEPETGSAPGTERSTRAGVGDRWVGRYYDDDASTLLTAAGVQPRVFVRGGGRDGAVGSHLGGGDREVDAVSSPWRIRVAVDPLFGPVISVGADDPVAEALSDQSWRLAPVAAETARDMVLRLGARTLLVGDPVDDHSLGAITGALVGVSRWFLHVPGLVDVDLRQARIEDGRLVAGEIVVEVGATDVDIEPPARRLRAASH